MQTAEKDCPNLPALGDVPKVPAQKERPQVPMEIVNLLPPGYYDRQSLCDQLNSALAAHGWGAIYRTVE